MELTATCATKNRRVLPLDIPWQIAGIFHVARTANACAYVWPAMALEQQSPLLVHTLV